MAERVLLDNDVIIKVAAWQLVAETLALTTLNGTPPSMLGVGRFVIRSRLARASNLVDRPAAAAAFEELLQSIVAVEPHDREISLAADLENAAIGKSLEFDTGESQLLAILVLRGCNLLLTGDKRAIRSIEIIAPTEAKERIGCLEQLIADLIGRHQTCIIRPRICGEPSADRAIAACFACSSPETPSTADVTGGLSSYCEHLRLDASSILLPGCDLSAVTT